MRGGHYLSIFIALLIFGVFQMTGRGDQRGKYRPDVLLLMSMV